MAMIEEDFETSLKIIVVGDGGVGKTSLIQRFCKGEFTENYKKTIGVDFLEKEWNDSSTGEDVRLMLWDTAGQEEFDSLTRAYYRGASAAVVVFSTVDRKSFENVRSWFSKVGEECPESIPVVLVQNKIDRIEEAVFTPEEAENLAAELGVGLFRTCVKTNSNVNQVFEYLVSDFLKKCGAADEGVTDIRDIQSPSKKQEERIEENPAPQVPKLPKPVDLRPSRQRTGGKKKRFRCALG
eukprot:TRINITY_DN42_c0_g1_i1.p1 TRINITY_DN42_c0_g1~~TRINITY_DN42_c0_g1_i1.p1  ORF type:complete len:239 (+),score=58.39 TRINITY_DN42_c0_g1_i1:71-787(+)